MLSLRRKDIVCQQAVELVTAYLEGALSRRERRRFEAHLRACPNCSAYLEQIKLTIEDMLDTGLPSRKRRDKPRGEAE